MALQFGKFWAGFGGRNRDTKAAPARKSIPLGSAWLQMSGPYWPGRATERLIDQGYCRNPVAHRCARMIVEAATSVAFKIETPTGIDTLHPVDALLQRPNVRQGRAQFLDRIYSHLLLEGDAFVEQIAGIDNAPAELHVLSPSRVTIVTDESGWPTAYDYRHGPASRRHTVDPVSGHSAVLHLDLPHPRDDCRGLAPLQVAAVGIDTHNAATDWNKALLDNAARPSGALVFEPREGQADVLTEEQVIRLRAQMEDYFQGRENAGRPFLLEGGLKWQQVAMSPMDMDFIASKNNAAREIALAFGVPPMLLGIPGDNTYANYAEANRALWRQTVIPLVNRVADAMGHWLGPFLDDPVKLQPDLDRIPALADERRAQWQRIGEANFLSDAEKRRLLGL